jgi:hypothetical protein
MYYLHLMKTNERKAKLIAADSRFPRIPGCAIGYRVQVDGRIVGQVGRCLDGAGWFARFDGKLPDFARTRAAAVAKIVWYVDAGYSPEEV